jgi:DNA repair ATPase RecN
MKKKEDVSAFNNKEDILFKIFEIEEQIKSSQKAIAQSRQDLAEIITRLQKLEFLHRNYWRNF